MIFSIESYQTVLRYCGSRIAVILGGLSLLGYAFCLYLENLFPFNKTASGILLLFAFLQGSTSHYLEEGLYAYYGGNRADYDPQSYLLDDIYKIRNRLKSCVKFA